MDRTIMTVGAFYAQLCSHRMWFPEHNTMSAKGHPLPLAFKKMIEQPGIWKRLRVSKQTVLNRRVLVGKGMWPKDTTMRKWLKKAGWKPVVVEKWAQ